MTISQIERLENRGITTTSRFKIILALADSGKIMSHVAEICSMSTAAITGLVDAMERDGIVTRTRSNGDRRTITLTLTEKGREALTEIKAL